MENDPDIGYEHPAGRSNDFERIPLRETLSIIGLVITALVVIGYAAGGNPSIDLELYWGLIR